MVINPKPRDVSVAFVTAQTFQKTLWKVEQANGMTAGFFSPPPHCFLRWINNMVIEY